ncbi:carboxylate--amine ligase [Sporosarcina sp. G11-34]|uniref:carboxylate--amine ligase n=1 Tax=Sporosarcina sp. G11-34 TaxID=2849605 RepID=UPI0022A96422|nr:ATP-grasp domain-containing protein [Sporosarcina sp. G11-34]MCZ2260221.1 ATP-grasp domain-containing protein [Sporosarcina sp. G11-34]
MGKTDFLPVILGSDDNAYGMARAFHEQYGITSIVVTKGHILPTMHSKIVEKKIYENLDEPKVFIQSMLNLHEELKSRASKLLVIASNENYAELAIRHRDELEPHYILPFIDEKLMDEVVYKERFYEMCEEYGLDYPDTLIFKKGMDAQMELPFDYPVVVKPSDSMTYFNAQFEGKKKAYVLHSKAEFIDTIDKVFSSTYEDSLIIQDYIPGNDTVMRVLNAYVDRNGKVKMMCLGRVILEDYTPTLIGNYVGIIGEYNKDTEEVYAKYKKFLEAIGFRGYANIDLKYDRRDGKYKIFELNIRQGRSSYFVTTNGYNMAKYLVEDRVENEDLPIEYGSNTRLWHAVPKDLLIKYTMDEDLKKQVIDRFKKGESASTLYYSADLGFIRRFKLKSYYKDYYRRFEEHFELKE